MVLFEEAEEVGFAGGNISLGLASVNLWPHPIMPLVLLLVCG